jgi:hypothetical protein
MAKEQASVQAIFHPLFLAAETEAKQLPSCCAMVHWRARMTDGQTVHMAMKYPNGVAKLDQCDYLASILKTLRMRVPKASPTSISVDRLTYEASPQQKNIQIL